MNLLISASMAGVLQEDTNDATAGRNCLGGVCLALRKLLRLLCFPRDYICSFQYELIYCLRCGDVSSMFPKLLWSGCTMTIEMGRGGHQSRSKISTTTTTAPSGPATHTHSREATIAYSSLSHTHTHTPTCTTTCSTRSSTRPSGR